MANKPQTYTEREMYEKYNEMLDEVYGEVNIGGLSYSTSHAMQQVDETAYRCGFSDWLDSEEYDDFEGQYAKRDEIEEYQEALEEENEANEEDEEEEVETND